MSQLAAERKPTTGNCVGGTSSDVVRASWLHAPWTLQDDPVVDEEGGPKPYEASHSNMETIPPFLFDPGRMATLTYLDLGGNRIGDSGLAALAALVVESPIRVLELYFNQITAVGINDFADIVVPDEHSMDFGAVHSPIEAIRLSWNDLEDEGAQAATRLFLLPSLTELNLGYNDIGPAGGESIRDAVRQSSTLKHLSLKGNDVTQSVIDSIDAVLLYNDKQQTAFGASMLQ